MKLRIQPTEEAFMRKKYIFIWLVLGAISLAAFPAGARPQADSTGGVRVSTVVTVLGPKFTPPPAISKDDITVHEGNERRDITNWIPAQGDKAGLELAIVVDDSNRKDVGKQFEDLTNFIKALPKSTSVGIYYARDNTISVASQFSLDHDAVAKTLRLPIGNGAMMSVYQSLMALIAGWPVSGARREILLLGDGFDRLRRERYSPDVQATVDKAQQAGIIIHAIFINGVEVLRRDQATQNPNARPRNPDRATAAKNVGQGNLNTLTDGTGGFAYFQGFATPIALEPFLTQLDLVLKNQYFLGWQTNRSKNAKGELRGFKVSTERSGVEIKAAQKVFVPGE
jgi:VWFA-related protein